jgi:predicted nucleotidyltransferase
MSAKIAIPEETLREFCRRWQITELALFGSALRDDFGSDSDVDVLVTFSSGTRWGFEQLTEMRRELEALWGRDVDLVEKRVVEHSENYIRRRHILDHAESVYVA